MLLAEDVLSRLKGIVSVVNNEVNIEKSIKVFENWRVNTNIIKNNENNMKWYFMKRDIVLMLLHEFPVPLVKFYPS